MKENIEYLEEFIKQYKIILEEYKDDVMQSIGAKSCYFDELPIQAIENLIKAYKELEENSISKDKIREKILERQFELQQEYEDFEGDEILNILEELLEE